MKKNKFIVQGIAHAAGVVLYVSGVALLMSNAQMLFGAAEDTIWAPIMFLLLFVVSATIVGLLVLGRPIYLYFDGKKKESIYLLIATVGWLFLFTVIIFAVQIGMNADYLMME